MDHYTCTVTKVSENKIHVKCQKKTVRALVDSGTIKCANCGERPECQCRHFFQSGEEDDCTLLCPEGGGGEQEE